MFSRSTSTFQTSAETCLRVLHSISPVSRPFFHQLSLHWLIMSWLAGFHFSSSLSTPLHGKSGRSSKLRRRPQVINLIVRRFMISFLILTYLSTRPCFYCTILLLILFASSCHWSDNCFLDLNANWFEPRQFSSTLPNPLPQATAADRQTCKSDASFITNAINETASALAGIALETLGRKIPKTEWTGIGFGWLRSLLGTREWKIPCLDILVRL